LQSASSWPPEAMGSMYSTPAVGEVLCHGPDAGGAAPASGPVEDGCGRSGGEGSLASGAFALSHEGFAVDVHKREGDVLGAALGNNEEGAVVVAVEEHGLFEDWNRAHPEQALRPGVIITEVNGVSGYWSILEEIQKPGALAMKVSSRPPRNAGANWLREIEEMGARFRKQGGVNTSSFMLRLQPKDTNTNSPAFSSLPTVRAGDCGVDRCAICLDDVGPEETLVQLPCGHAFHSLCAARWLSEGGRNGCSKRQCCPLCCRRVTFAPHGNILETE